MAKTGASVLIIGAGPAGLAVAKSLLDLGIDYELVDRFGEPGGSYLRMYGDMQLSSPPSYLTLPGGGPPASKDYLRVRDYVNYLKHYAVENDIRAVVREVRTIERKSSGFQVTFEGDRCSANYPFVVACTGSFEHPNVPILEGLNDEASTGKRAIEFDHACNWRGPKHYESDRLLIVGGGMTAIELAEECVESQVRPIMSFKAGRGRTFPIHLLRFNPRVFVYPFMRRLPSSLFRRQCWQGWSYRGIDRGFKKYCKLRLIDLRPSIAKIVDKSVTFTDGSTACIDHIVFATGYRWHMPFLPKSVPIALQGNPLLRRGQSTVWPGFFCVGITCAFTPSSHFIHGIFDDAPKVAKEISKIRTGFLT